MYDDLQSMLRCIVWVKRGGLNTQSREERQCALVREGGDGGGGERERRTCNQCCVASHGQRMAGMPPEVWRGGMSTLRRVSGSNESRAAVRRAVVARLVAGETELRTAGREGEGLCSGRSRRRAARARAHARAPNAPPQSFKASSSLLRPHKDDEGMVGSRVRRELKLHFWPIDAQKFLVSLFSSTRI